MQTWSYKTLVAALVGRTNGYRPPQKRAWSPRTWSSNPSASKNHRHVCPLFFSSTVIFFFLSLAPWLGDFIFAPFVAINIQSSVIVVACLVEFEMK